MKIYYLTNAILLIVVARWITKLIARPIRERVRESLVKKGVNQLLESGHWTFHVFFSAVFGSYVLLTGIFRGNPIVNVFAVTVYMLIECVAIWSRECTALDENSIILSGDNRKHIRENNRRRATRFILAWIVGTISAVFVSSLVQWKLPSEFISLDESTWFIMSVWPYIVLSLVLLFLSVWYKPSWISFFRVSGMTFVPCTIAHQIMSRTLNDYALILTTGVCLVYLVAIGSALLVQFNKMDTVRYRAKYCFAMFYISIALNILNVLGFVHVIQHRS
ncbi:MAG: hypothetical protein GF411_20370 [Candidatus Lokiarchaeota archaeon]|nr:hypothetical protein [Candidatus Lokiarchaeota archaeon]